MDSALAIRLYHEHADDLRRVIGELAGFTAPRQLDDIEAELTYLLLRHHRPASVLELGTFHGWSTNWLLRALRDNEHGQLHSFDRVDHVLRAVPAVLADRWTFIHGDVRETLPKVPFDVGYLFVDADHGARFARWYLAELFPLMPAGIPVSVHDVLSGRRPRPWSEGSVVTAWLRDQGITPFTASRQAAPEVFALLQEVRAELGITGARGTTRNPMIFFSLP
ncbi:class I SAM-dependent methyltransferase [Pseudonocardia sp. CA-107938]|uniref:class I SAM-dependent methyltransferase n=1 Tax=Pseudonocardia sp. CA-107938 TaxID=3240021 RepID=UPI003D8DD083